MFFKLNKYKYLVGRAANTQCRLFSKVVKHSLIQHYSKMDNLNSGATNLVWMDLEMTGLDVNKDKILEVSCLITDAELNIKSEGPCIVIKQPREVLDNMNEWCMKHHNESGLVAQCLKSEITTSQAESILLDYLKQHIPERKCPLAGNSVYMDRLFVRQYFPTLDEYLHYRIVDVSTIKELASRWRPDLTKGAPKKKFAHRSLDDIKDSIDELKYYREHFIKLQ